MSAAKKVKTSHAAANGGGVHANGGISGMGAVDADRYSYLASNDAVRKITTETRAQLLKMAEGKLSKENSAICLAGGKSGQWDFYDNDTTWTFFRQEPYFRYLFGVNEPDLFGFICLSSGLSVLFIPKIPEEVWRVTGVPPTLEEYRQTYGLGQVHYLEDMNKVLQDLGLKKLFVMKGTNTDSGIETVTRPEFEGISKFELDDSALFPVLSESRVFKTPEEISFMRTANEVSSAGHRFVMELCKGGMWERQLEASFKGYCGMHGGARHEAYDCICASGPNAAVLHYGHAGAPNDRRMQDGDMVLLDMGCEYNGYATDITHTFPVSGKFTENQKVIYEGVLSASTTVKSQLRPGIQWLDMHRAAEREILKALKKAGVLNETAEMEEMIEADLGAVFMPHGLGHFLGLNVHDVGGYNQGAKRNPRPGLKYCRTSRALQEGMVLTVEPGCYFVDFLLDKALKDPKHSKFLNPEGVQKFRGFGGVRIEDNVLITADGHDCFTDVPRTVEDIERAMAAH